VIQLLVIQLLVIQLLVIPSSIKAIFNGKCSAEKVLSHVGKFDLCCAQGHQSKIEMDDEGGSEGADEMLREGKYGAEKKQKKKRRADKCR
jgi:hypothetical protein